jgi:hypothetical protein
MTTTPAEPDPVDPAVADLEDLEQTDVEGSIERDPDEAPNADYDDPETRPAATPGDAQR